MAERQFGPYRLVRQIAVGGMAEIHLAKTAGIAGFEKYVALKMIHPNFAEDDQFIQMLVDEAKIAVQLTHGNIAQTFDLGRVGETYYITMEYVDGADLYKILRRASEQEVPMPLDVCAFVGKEISSALDHAHRKRDHTGKSLGIVHRDVSPQNVLVSYSGEVKLVDFGIAKATMKVRQTAVGVIKGKYYYMSPEQAWGDPIDHRSDIFSAGIVLYEMITGQMLYLEEDLHKLLEMARSADIAPPSKLRRGVPPQLERIVMHALAKVPGERYQTAGDFATDLERFLHAYSPVFTASKLSALLRTVVGDPLQVPNADGLDNVELRDGLMSTHPLDDAEVAHAIDRAELRDENSVIFRMSELRGSDTQLNAAQPVAPPQRLTPPRKDMARPSAPAPGSQIAPRVTRATDSLPVVPRMTSRPSQLDSTGQRAAGRAPTGRAAVVSSTARSTGSTKIPQVTKQRQPHEETRQIAQAPADPLHDDSSGLLVIEAGSSVAKLAALPRGIDEPRRDEPEPSFTADFELPRLIDDDLDNIGERTQVTTIPGMSFMMDFTGDDGQVEATLVTSAPTDPGFGAEDSTAERRDDAPSSPAREPPTTSLRVKNKAQPAALSAKIHAPAVSELRKPRASRRTPPTGSPVTPPNVLQAIVASRASEPMPAPRQAPPPLPPQAVGSAAVPPPLPPQALRSAPAPDGFGSPMPLGTPGSHAAYTTDASGLPLGIASSPGLAPSPAATPTPFAAYAMQGMPGGHAPEPIASPPAHAAGSGSSYSAPLSPSSLYPFPPPQQNLSLTGQMRLLDVDELPSHYKLGADRPRWMLYAASGIVAISVAAIATFVVIRALQTSAPVTGWVHVESVPSGADVRFNGTLLEQKTPLTIDQAPPGSRHTIRVELAHYLPYEETVDIPAKGGEIAVAAKLVAITRKLVVESAPPNAEVRINGEVRGRTPMTINDIDPESAKLLELRLKDYQPYVKDLKAVAWPVDGKLRISAKLAR